MRNYYYYYDYDHYHYYHLHVVVSSQAFSPRYFLNQWRSPLLSLEVSDCSTFRIMCDVPSIVVFCSESVDCFPGMASKFFV
jgi:hypothetical protein